MDTISLTQWMVAASPILVLFLTIALFRLKVHHAALISLATAFITAFVLKSLSVDASILALGSGTQTTFIILYTIWPAIILYELMKESGSFDVVQSFVSHLTSNDVILTLFFSWVFASFMQSVAGFGVPVAVCAPFLLALGIKPVKAIIMTLIGHSWGNTFGALGMAWATLVEMTHMPNQALTALYASVFLALINGAGACLIAYMYAGKRALIRSIPFILLIALVHGAGSVIVSQLSPTLTLFIPTLLGLAVALIMFKLGLFTKPWPGEKNGAPAQPKVELPSMPTPREVIRAVAPFLFLAVGSLLLFAVTPISNTLDKVSLFGVHVLQQPGFVLMLAGIVTAVLNWDKLKMKGERSVGSVLTQRSAVTVFGPSLKRAINKLLGTSASIFVLVVFARFLQETQQMDLLAAGTAHFAGSMYLPLAPLVGMVGGFITSSNLSSNILLGAFQQSVADTLAVDSAIVLGGHTAGAATGAVFGPSTTLLGATTLSVPHKVGHVLRKMVVVGITQSAVIGLLVWLLV